MRILTVLAVVGLLVAPAMADVTTSATRMPGSYEAIDAGGGVDAIRYVPDGSASGRAVPRDGAIYDNVPTFWGGRGTYGTGASPYWGARRWISTTAAWGDDLHDITCGPSMSVTFIQYGAYQLAAGTVSHVINLYTGASLDYGPTTTLISLPSAPFATYTPAYNITAPGYWLLNMTLDVPLHLTSNSMYVSYLDPAYTTYWLTGGNPGIGTSFDAVLYDVAGTPFAYWVPGPFIDTSGGVETGRSHANIGMVLGIPEPTTIALLGLSGLFALRRRKA